MHLYCTRINKCADENKRAETAFKSSSFLFPGVTLSLMYSCTDNSFELFSLHRIYLDLEVLTLELCFQVMRIILLLVRKCFL